MNGFSRAASVARTLAYGLQHYAKKKRHERQIRQLDERTPFGGTALLNGLAHRRWAVSDARTIFGASMADLLVPAMSHLPAVDSMGNALTRRVPAACIELLLASSALSEVVQRYLGEGARLDDLYLWKKDFSVQKRFDISEGWHTDNVGNRLKMFVGVDATEGAPSTCIVDRTHNQPYKVGVGELKRFFGQIAEPQDPQSVVEINYGRDVIAIFDTNALHRGSYASTRAHRVCLIVEFIDRRKSDLLSGACPCGPGQSPVGRIEFSRELHPLLQRHPLIDPTLLRQEASMVSYSIANKRRLVQ